MGLLAGTNDLELLARSQVGRDINRHHYTPSEIATSLDLPVVLDLLDLIRLRNTHPAFAGDFRILPSPANVIGLEWTHASETARLVVDLKAGPSVELTFTENGFTRSFEFASRSRQTTTA